MEKYEEALERARKGMPIDEVFPELKQSEDERIRKSIIAYLSNELHNVKQLTPRTDEFEHWIAYLDKQEHIATEAYNKGFADGTVAERESEELERKKEQKPAEWSEEDDNAILIAISWLEYYRDTFVATEQAKDEITTCVERLKSLHPHPNWKPSEEQMKAMKLFVEKHRHTANTLDGGWPSFEAFESLYNDLKKL